MTEKVGGIASAVLCYSFLETSESLALESVASEAISKDDIFTNHPEWTE